MKGHRRTGAATTASPKMKEEESIPDVTLPMTENNINRFTDAL